MTTTGLPPWSRSSGVGQYGASETLDDYLSLGPPNVLDSVSASEYAALAQAVAWVSATAPMFTLRITDNLTGAAPPVEAFSMADGHASYTGDSPPSGFPTVAYVSPGRHSVTLGSTYDDDAGVTGGFVANFPYASGDNLSEAAVYVTGAGTTSLTVIGVDAGGAVASTTAVVEIA